MLKQPLLRFCGVNMTEIEADSLEAELKTEPREEDCDTTISMGDEPREEGSDRKVGQILSKLRLTVTGELCPTGTYNPTILRPGYENPRMFLTNNHVKAETGAMPRGELQSVLVKLVHFPRVW